MPSSQGDHRYPLGEPLSSAFPSIYKLTFLSKHNLQESHNMLRGNQIQVIKPNGMLNTSQMIQPGALSQTQLFRPIHGFGPAGAPTVCQTSVFVDLIVLI